MESSLYNANFDAITPMAKRKIEQIAQALTSKYKDLRQTEVTLGGDEEVFFTTSFFSGDELFLCLEFTLVDGGLHEEEAVADEFGVGISVYLFKDAGLPIGVYVATNRSGSVLTQKQSVLKAMVDSVDVGEIVDYVEKDRLRSEQDRLAA